MIYTFFADIRDIDLSVVLEKYKNENNLSAPNSYLSSSVISHIEKAKEPRLKKERTGAYLLLATILKEKFGLDMNISWTENGKPKYEGEKNIYFNLSHTEDTVAVTVSENTPVGVDIEEEIEEERARRLEARFFGELSFSDRPLSVEYSFCKIEKDGNFKWLELDRTDRENEKKDCCISVFTNESFSARWTLYEACMKCDGGGFTSLPCLGMLLLECRADTKKIFYKDKVYYLSTAVTK